MEIPQLVAAITACTNPDGNIRKAGEDALKQVRAEPRPASPAWHDATLPSPAALHSSLPHLAPHLTPLQQHLARGGLVNLLRVALEDSMDPAVRQVASITFKNAVKRDWESRGRSYNVFSMSRAIDFAVLSRNRAKFLNFDTPAPTASPQSPAPALSPRRIRPPAAR